MRVVVKNSEFCFVQTNAQYIVNSDIKSFFSSIFCDLFCMTVTVSREVCSWSVLFSVCFFFQLFDVSPSLFRYNRKLNSFVFSISLAGLLTLFFITVTRQLLLLTSTPLPFLLGYLSSFTCDVNIRMWCYRLQCESCLVRERFSPPIVVLQHLNR